MDAGFSVLVGTGEAVPVACEVIQGHATIITIEHLTGQIKPSEAKVSDRIPGGARNLDGRMIVKVCLQHVYSGCFVWQVAFWIFLFKVDSGLPKHGRSRLLVGLCN